MGEVGLSSWFVSVGSGEKVELGGDGVGVGELEHFIGRCLGRRMWGVLDGKEWWVEE